MPEREPTGVPPRAGERGMLEAFRFAPRHAGVEMLGTDGTAAQGSRLTAVADNPARPAQAFNPGRMFLV